EGVGMSPEKDSYVQLNHYNVKYGEFDEWRRLETTYWKPLVEAWLKGGGKGGWGLNALLMPAGGAPPHNALTVDIFPTWNAFVSGVPLTELWPKVHPSTTSNTLFDRLEKVRSVHDREVYKIVDVVRGK